MIDFIVEGIIEIFSEIFLAILASKPLQFIEKHIKSKTVCSIVEMLVLLMCAVIGVLITIALVIGVIAAIIYFMKK